MSVTSPVPAALRILRSEQRLEIDWADGHASTYETAALRWLCPCAYCRGEAGMPGWLDTNPSLTPQQSNLVGGGIIGNYAVCL
ncbi:MAG: gamma-butyrobetaine hydroxylase-like domain-containing protein, partial [Candidatus Limnocylindrus sp.]